MNREEIKRIISHREPMLLIDTVVDMEEGERILAEFYVEPTREIFKGHFPEEPVFPGVYTVEVMAQASDILLLSMERYKGMVPLFLGIDKVKFLKKITPGSTLEITSILSNERKEKAIATCSATVRVGGEVVAAGEVTLAMR